MVIFCINEDELPMNDDSTIMEVKQTIIKNITYQPIILI